MFKFILSSLFSVLLTTQIVFPVSAESAESGRKGTKIIYGKDDRKDLYNVSNPLYLALADSTVAIFKDEDVNYSLFRGIQLRGGTFQQQKKVCNTEPFYDQPAGAYCSGTLIAKNLVLTAGHCIKSESDCQKSKIVFGFGITEKDVYPYRANRNEVYRCSHIVTRQESEDGRDYEVIELDRDVIDHKPIKIASAENANPALASGVVMIGHPYGLPTKVDDGGSVLKNEHPHYFVATTDSYSGSSGSAVFNSKTGEIIGVLTSGEINEFMDSYPHKCFVSRVCGKKDCEGEKINRVSFIPALVAPHAH